MGDDQACIVIEYEACEHELKVSGENILDRNYTIDLDDVAASSEGKVTCQELDIPRLTKVVRLMKQVADQVGYVMPIDDAMIRNMAIAGPILQPEICVRFYNVQMSPYHESFTYQSKVYFHVKNNINNIVPNNGVIDIPALDVDDGTLGIPCHSFDANMCLMHPACGYCADGAGTGQCYLGTKEGPLCSSSSSSPTSPPIQCAVWKMSTRTEDPDQQPWSNNPEDEQTEWDQAQARMHAKGPKHHVWIIVLVSCLTFGIIVAGVFLYRQHQRNPATLQNAVGLWRQERYAHMSEPDPQGEDVSLNDENIPTATVVSVGP